MVTRSLKRHCSRSFEASSREIQIDSDKVSVHRQFPFRTNAFPDLLIVFPVFAEIRDKESLSHPLGT